MKYYILAFVILTSAICNNCSAGAQQVAFIYSATYMPDEPTEKLWGREELRGAEIALEYFKSTNNKSNPHIEKYAYSNTPLSVVKAVNTAYSNGIRLYTGIAWSNDVVEAMSMSPEKKFNLISSMASSSKIQAYDRAVSMAPSNEAIISKLLNYISNTDLACSRFGIVYAADSEYPIDILNILKKHPYVKKHPIIEYPILTNEDIPTETVKSLRNLNSSDCLFVALHEYEAATAVSIVTRSADSPTIIGGDSLGDTGQLFWKLIPKKQRHYVRGYSAFPWDLNNNSDLSLEYIRRYIKKYSTQPDSLSYFTFKAVLASLALQYNQCIETKPIKKCVIDKVAKKKLSKLNINLTDDGYSRSPIAILQLHDGRHKLIKVSR